MVHMGMFLAVVIFIAVFIVFWLKVSGFFNEIIVNTGHPSFDKLTIAYKFARGPYKSARELFRETKLLVPHLQSIGIYYNDIKQAAASCELGYAVGVILSKEHEEVSENDQNLLVSHGYKIFRFPSINNVVMTSFPYTGNLSLFVAILRIYPKLSSYIQNRKLCAHPFIEIYSSDKIQFFAPLSQQDEFYVPEVQMDIDLDKDSHQSTDTESLPGVDFINHSNLCKEEESNSSFEELPIPNNTSDVFKSNE